MVGDEWAGKITMTITGNSLHFHRDTDFWFDTTFTLPAGTYPQQLHATIKDCPEPCDDIGRVVFAIFKIEGETLTLVGIPESRLDGRLSELRSHLAPIFTPSANARLQSRACSVVKSSLRPGRAGSVLNNRGKSFLAASGSILPSTMPRM